MITYLHEEFIASAILGVLMQEIDFDMELVISDDASPDKTEEVVQKLMEGHPKGRLIRYIKHDSNKGMMNNFSWAIQQCRGEYIALCEGDDYWIDPLKLKRQVDFLEKNSECSFCFHQAYRINRFLDLNKVSPYPNEVYVDKLSIQDFFKIGGKATSSVVFRNFVPQALNDLNHLHGDFLLYISLFAHGIGGFIKIPMSIYRIHSGGVSSDKGSFNYLQKRIRELKVEQKYFNDRNCKREVHKQYIIHVYIFLRRYKKCISSKQFCFFAIELLTDFYFYRYFFSKKFKL